MDKPHSRDGINDPLELYDWFFNCYSTTPKERLLEFMRGSPDYQHLTTLAGEELASLYCERLVYATLRRSGPPKDRMSAMVAQVVEEAFKPIPTTTPKAEVKPVVQTGDERATS